MNAQTQNPATEAQTAEVQAGTETVAASAQTANTEASPAKALPDIAALVAQASAEAKAETLAYFAEVTELCQLANMPEKAAAFIAKAVPVAEISKALLTAKAAADEATAISGQHQSAVSTQAGDSKIDTAAIYAARNNPKGK